MEESDSTAAPGSPRNPPSGEPPSGSAGGVYAIAPTEPPGKPPHITVVWLLGCGLIAFAFLLVYLFVTLWPIQLPTEDTSRRETIVLFDLITIAIHIEVQIFLLVMIAGGLGAFVHTATSFADYMGNEKLTRSWTWWYVLRPFIGMFLAGIFYLVFRGGFLSAGTNAGEINVFGTTALAALVGMFSKQATDKLNEVFDTLFRTAPGAGDSKRKDDLKNPVPLIAEVVPKRLVPRASVLDVTVGGSGFVDGSVVQVNGSNRQTHFLNATKLASKLMPEDVEDEGELEIAVFSPSPGGGLSAPIRIKVAAPPPGNPPYQPINPT